MAADSWRTTTAVPVDRVRAHRVPGWDLVAFLGAFLVVAVSHTRQYSTDAYISLAGGREIMAHGLPHADTMTVAGAGSRWIDQQWLGQVVLFRLWQMGGYALVSLISAAATAAAIGMLCRLLIQRGATPRRAIKWSALALAGLLADVSIRTQDFAYPLFVALLMLVLADSGRAPTRRGVIAGASVLVVWANIHGSVLVGIALVGFHCLYHALRPGGTARLRYLACAAAAPLALLATPYGTSITAYYQSVLGNSAIRDYSSEWQPAVPTNLAALGYLAVVVAVLVVVVGAWRHGVRPQPELGLLAAACALGAFSAVRWAAWPAIIGAVLAADLLNVWQPAGTGSARPPRLLWLGTAGSALAVCIVFIAASPASYGKTVPLGAMDAAAFYMGQHPGAKLLPDDQSASAMLWLHPEVSGRVAMDGRLEIYPQAEVRAWADYVRADSGALQFTRGYQVFLVASSNARLVHLIRRSPSLRVLYSGADGIVAVRQSGVAL